MMKLLLTAFEPFDGESVNPSLIALQALERMRFDGAEIAGVELPVDRFKAVDIALNCLLTEAPDVVVMLGESGGRSRVSPERVAINIDDFSIPDHAGHQPRGEPIIKGGPVGYFSTLPIDAIADQLGRHHIPAKVSNTAGTYLCNRLFYRVMHDITVEKWPIRAGFIHLPYLHEQTVHKRFEFPSLSRQTVIDAVRLALEIVCQNPVLSGVG